MSYHNKKRKEFLNQLEDGCVVALINDQIEGKKCSRNFFYLTGIEFPGCAYLAVKKHGQVNEAFFLPRVDPRRVHFEPQPPSPEEITRQTGIEQVLYQEVFAKLLGQALDGASCAGFDLDPRQEEWIMRRTRALCTQVRADWPALRLRNVFYDISWLRMFKTPEELLHIKNAMRVTEAAIRRGMRVCKPGMYEYELEAEFRHELGRNHMTPGFPSIVAAGGNEFCLHYNAIGGQISDGDLVLMDVGAEENGYCVDISRVFPANGAFSEKQRLIYEAAYRANETVRRAVKPGFTFQEMNEACRRACFEQLRELGLLREYAEIGRYCWHNVSHYVGLDVHDVGSYDVPMAPNMYFVVDAGIYVQDEGWNIGLRLEDNVFLNEKGECELWSANIPRTVEEIEAACRA